MAEPFGKTSSTETLTRLCSATGVGRLCRRSRLTSGPGISGPWCGRETEMAYVGCESCNRRLREEDGPLCADCAALKRSEAARTAAEARWEKESPAKPEKGADEAQGA